MEKPNRNAIDRNNWRPEEVYNNFANSRNLLGRRRSNTNWFQNYEAITDRSGSTGWDVTMGGVPNVRNIRGRGQGQGSANQPVNLGIQSGTLTINYNMQNIPDRMQIINSADGSIIFDTANTPGAFPGGRVANRQGSGQTVTFDLGDGNTNITNID